MTAKRLFDLSFSLLVLILTSPLLVLAAVGVKLSDPGPVLHCSRRVGRNGADFLMYKFRSMRHRRATAGPRVTADNDDRVFAFGSLLRKTKLDELPQLINIILGDMSIVGPRPEDPKIVIDYYGPPERETLAVKPGLTSPGTIFAYTHGRLYLDDEDPEGSYIRKLLRPKLYLERVYVRNQSFFYDLRILARTVRAMMQVLVGRQIFPDPPELATSTRETAHANEPTSRDGWWRDVGQADARSRCGSDPSPSGRTSGISPQA